MHPFIQCITVPFTPYGCFCLSQQIDKNKHVLLVLLSKPLEHISRTITSRAQWFLLCTVVVLSLLGSSSQQLPMTLTEQGLWGQGSVSHLWGWRNRNVEKAPACLRAGRKAVFSVLKQTAISSSLWIPFKYICCKAFGATVIYQVGKCNQCRL